MTIGVRTETANGERRVALVPSDVAAEVKGGSQVLIQAGAGELAGYSDQEYADKGAEVVQDAGEILKRSDILLTVRFAAADKDNAEEQIAQLKENALVVGLMEPYANAELFQKMAQRGVTAFSLELLPRITRAQSMDVLSSTANLAGYKAALIAADRLPRLFPMMMTAAGTIVPAKVFVVGVGVAGLQAIATAKRLGAVVSAYDVRPAVKEQVQSLGAKFVEMELESAEGSGGYAKEMGEEFYRKQRELMAAVLAETDAVITTASIPGKPAPRLITTEMVEGMSSGSVVIDLAAERGGNCELTKVGETVMHKGVSIIGPENIASQLAYTAGRLYSKNITTFLKALRNKENVLEINREDEIVAATLVTYGGEIVAASLGAGEKN
ncbi:MAG: Re/Si-specific NAD(P)(+) transhydrogenase subunit alpha [Spirochaeta sp.]|nr:Re/Si-specific NAD(P)(+) transhydrogenase subunit alpha [Spirochaeta sp.]